MSHMEQNGFYPVEMYENLKHDRILDPRQVGRDSLVIVMFKALGAPRHLGTWKQRAKVLEVENDESNAAYRVDFSLLSGYGSHWTTGLMFDGFWNTTEQDGIVMRHPRYRSSFRYSNGFVLEDNTPSMPDDTLAASRSESDTLAGAL